MAEAVQLADLSFVLTAGFLVGLSQLLCLLIGPAYAFAVAAATAAVAGKLSTFYAPRLLVSWWPLPLLLALANGAGVAAFMSSTSAGHEPGGWYWLIPPVAVVCFLGVRQLDRVTRRRCALCNRRFMSETGFECPRCQLVACEQHCWSFEGLRCKACLENEVPALSPDSRWWDREFGPRSERGQCQVCMTPADQADLRACRRCGRTQCRHCWDMCNGQCLRCRWIAADLPPALLYFMRDEATASPGENDRGNSNQCQSTRSISTP